MFRISEIIGVNFLHETMAHIYIDTGNQNFSRRGQVASLGDDELVKYDGKNAWKSPVKINGSLEFMIKPLSSNDEVEIFLRDQMRSVKFMKIKEVMEEQFQLHILQWDPTNYDSNLDTFDSQIPGINNLTRFTGYGMVSSLPFLATGKFHL